MTRCGPQGANAERQRDPVCAPHGADVYARAGARRASLPDPTIKNPSATSPAHGSAGTIMLKNQPSVLVLKVTVVVHERPADVDQRRRQMRRPSPFDGERVSPGAERGACNPHRAALLVDFGPSIRRVSARRAPQFKSHPRRILACTLRAAQIRHCNYLFLK